MHSRLCGMRAAEKQKELAVTSLILDLGLMPSQAPPDLCTGQGVCVACSAPKQTLYCVRAPHPSCFPSVAAHQSSQLLPDVDTPVRMTRQSSRSHKDSGDGPQSVCAAWRTLLTAVTECSLRRLPSSSAISLASDFAAKIRSNVTRDAGYPSVLALCGLAAPATASALLTGRCVASGAAGIVLQHKGKVWGEPGPTPPVTSV
mmetsp:Transcript_31530/g.77291  ORF Transcript_31530/g.77291 Transcript_31530/m.77291 type:complete len:202 (+) Transcript_31530:246-851(+)